MHEAADQPREIKIINLMGMQRVREEVGRQAISRMVYARPSLIQPQILAFVVIFTSNMHTYFKGDRRPLYFYTPGLPSPKAIFSSLSAKGTSKILGEFTALASQVNPLGALDS